MPTAQTLQRTLDAMPDTVDFRDVMYVPSLIEVPRESDFEAYRRARLPILDQGKEGACTGFGMAAVANYLVRGRGKIEAADEVSAWMLYAMAKRYDEWPGEKYEGSSARGAMKGWHKHGVCALRLWRDAKGGVEPDLDYSPSRLEEERAADSITRPLGAYFRVNHKDLVAMHSAITEVGILYATARVHDGWNQVSASDGFIPQSSQMLGGHAFAIVAYDRSGFWIQNSWGTKWGKEGFARISYADWLENGTDVWVAAIGVPVDLGRGAAAGNMRAGAERSYETYVYSALRPHIVTSKNDGQLDPKGVYGLTKEGLRSIVEEQMVQRMSGWGRKRLMLHAHGGLVSEGTAVQYIANNREAALKAEIYPLSFIWRSDAWSTLRNILQDALSRRRDEGLLDRTKDFMLDRLDDTLEPLARVLGGKALWDEMKENAQRATSSAGGAARLTADLVAAQKEKGALDELHLVGHSAGAIFHAYLARYLAQKNVGIDSVTLWAPACTIDLFEQSYRPLLEEGKIGAFRLFTLNDATEQDDHCAGIYHKSLLYLVSGAFERRPRIPLIQKRTPLLGLERDAGKIESGFWDGDNRDWFVAPGLESRALHHGDFDNDETTVRATFGMISGGRISEVQSRAHRSSPRGLADRRRNIEVALARL